MKIEPLKLHHRDLKEFYEQCQYETENRLPTKMTRTSLSVQQFISNAVCFFCDSAAVFSNQDFAGKHFI